MSDPIAIGRVNHTSSLGVSAARQSESESPSIKIGKSFGARADGRAGNCSGGWLAATCSGDREVAVNEVANGAEGGLSGEARGAGDG